MDAVVLGGAALHIALKVADLKDEGEMLIPAAIFVAPSGAATYYSAPI